MGHDQCYETLEGTLRLGWLGSQYDICIAGGLLVLCSYMDNGVAGVSLSDWQTKWNESVNYARCVCPGTPGSVFVACGPFNTIEQLSLEDGSVLTQLPLVPGVEFPSHVRNHNDILYVAHKDAELKKFKNQRDWKISQYKF